jgi:HK97 gp10 family phage protein
LASSFSFDTSRFESPKVMERKLKDACYATVKFWQGPSEAYMKHNAPWHDRTSNARNGLRAKAGRAGSKFFITLFYSVDYGIYLEDGTRNMRARPIIRPTISAMGPKVIRTLTDILDRL